MPIQDRVEEAIKHGRRIIRQNEKMRKSAGYDALNEATTRYAIIDPILRALGWKLDDPSHCQVEQWQERAGKEHTGRSDYLLIKDGRPVVVIEAERLSKSLNGWTEEKQLQGYDEPAEHRLAVLTNGRIWYFYGQDTGHSYGEYRVPDVNISEVESSQAAQILIDSLSSRKRW